MFERAGFRVVARRQSNPTTPVRPIVRLELRASSSRANSPGPGVDIVMRWRRSVPAEFRRYITEQRRRQHPELAICWYALLRVGIRSCGEGGPFLTHTDCREDGASNAPCESATRDKSQLDGVAFIAMELVGEGGVEPPTRRV